jgi:hypothetical protein
MCTTMRKAVRKAMDKAMRKATQRRGDIVYRRIKASKPFLTHI